MEEIVEQKAKRQHKPLVNQQVLEQRAKGWITAREAALLGGISVPRIYVLVDAGRLVGMRKGARRYVSKASVEAYFADKHDNTEAA